jgi:hypothetical protein
MRQKVFRQSAAAGSDFNRKRDPVAACRERDAFQSSFRSKKMLAEFLTRVSPESCCAG